MDNFSYACTGVGLAMFINELSMTPLLLAGDEHQKETFLRPMADEPLMAVGWTIFDLLHELYFQAYCVTESGAGSDVAAIRTKAVRDGDDYVLNGTKAWISNGGKASWLVYLSIVLHLHQLLPDLFSLLASLSSPLFAEKDYTKIEEVE